MKESQQNKEINDLISQITDMRDKNSRKSVTHDATRDFAQMRDIFTASKFADENLDLLRSQLTKLGQQPVEHIPLVAIRSELAVIMTALNDGQECDENRLDHLLRCLEWNKEFNQEEEQKRIARNAAIAPFVAECGTIMRGYVPASISRESEVSLRQAGLSPPLAKRIFSKKCLWLIRMSSDSISRLHEADLINRYSPDAQKLDLVELAAVYNSLPVVFLNDTTGRKQQVRVKLENDIHKLLEERSKQLSSTAEKFRNHMYQLCPPPFTA